MTQSQKGGLHRKLTLNSFSNLSRYVLSMGIAFFLTPFIVRTIGDTLYGFWVLLLSFVGYASILEMGVQPAVVKLVGQYKARGDTHKLRQLVTTAFVFFLCTSTLAALFCVFFVPGLVDKYIEDLRGLDHSRWLFIAIAVEAIVMYMSYLFTGILYGFQRYHLKNLIDACGWIINAVLVVIFLPRGGLLALVISKLVMDFAVLIGSVIAVKRVFPEFGLAFTNVGPESFRELIGFGGRIFVSATTSRIANHAQPIIISTALSSAATTFFAIPLRLVDYARQIAWALTAGFMPMFSELESRQEKETLREIYLGYSRYLFMGLLPIMVLLFVYGAPFIGVWIGPEYEDKSRVTLYFLAGMVLAESFQPLLWRFFIGVGQLNVLIWVSAVTSLLSVVGSFTLVRVMGIEGVALSAFSAAAIAQSIFAVRSCRYLEITPLYLFRRTHLRPVVSGLVTFGVAMLMSRTFGAANLLTIAIGSAVSMAVYVSLSLFYALDAHERGYATAKIAGRLKKTPPPPGSGV